MSEQERLQRLAEEMGRDPEVLADVRLFQQEVERALVEGWEIGEDPAFVLAQFR